MLPELLQGAQTDHRPTAEPERRHGPKLLMQADEELVQTASAHDVLQVSIPAERRYNLDYNSSDRTDYSEDNDEYLLLICRVETRNTRSPSG